MSFEQILIKANILIIDNNKNFLKACGKEFGKVGNVFPVRNVKDAKMFLVENNSWVDIVLCNINLRSPYVGMRYVYKLKQEFPYLTVCLMTSRIRKNYKVLNDGIFCIEKNDDISTMTSPVLHHWILERQSKNEFKEKRQSILKQLPYKETIKFQSKKTKRGVVAVDSWLLRTMPMKSIRSVFYRHPNHPLRLSCGVSVSRGCRFGCLTCLTGKRVKKCDVIDLEKSEIIAQVLHGLDTYLAYGCLTGEYDFSVEFTCGGDWISKPSPVFETIVEIDAVPEMNHPLFIISTIGNMKVFKKYLPLLVGYKVRIYLSVHSLDKSKREWLMPGTKGQSLEETREILSWFARITGQKWTFSWMLIKGFNDSDADIDAIASFCEGYPVDVKVMLMEGELNQYMGKVSEQEGLNFVFKLKQKNVDARFAVNMGSGKTASNMTCGTTISTQDLVEGQ